MGSKARIQSTMDKNPEQGESGSIGSTETDMKSFKTLNALKPLRRSAHERTPDSDKVLRSND